MKKILTITFLLFSLSLFSQEMLIGLEYNPKILKTNIEQNNSKSTIVRTLPFIDDFSSESIFPSNFLWEDKNVFINNDYPLYPVSVGVATFDALDSKGKLYSHAVSTDFPADTLTSVKIRLDSFSVGTSFMPITISDSIYFSFYYQPQGKGDAPESEDSLLLEFYSNSQMKWFKVWSVAGTTMQKFYNTNHQYFKPVLIALTDSARFFSKNFQFRFRNYASIANNNIPSWAGNVDQWNIDYVYLNRLRSKADTVFRDICFVEKAPSLLKDYQAMPWKQFLVSPATQMKDSLSILISNLDTNVRVMGYKYEIFNKDKTLVHTHDGGSANISPFVLFGYQNYQPHAHPLVDYIFPSSASDSAKFLVRHVLREGISGDNRQQNDTICYSQNFYNYYAYDDGCPEAGYGLTPANSKLAVKFTLNTNDTLRAIDIFFNRTYNNASQKYFYLTVWSSLLPETVIYQKQGCKPYYMDSLNLFYRYFLDAPLSIKGTFYIGWRQTTDDNLNIGFDKNTNSNTDIYYNTDGSWKNTMYNGSLMIRPVIGNPLPIGITNVHNNISNIILFPNPVTDNQIHFQSKDTESLKNLKEIFILDITGRIVYQTKFCQSILLPDLENGIYFIDIRNNQGVSAHKDKLIIIK